MFNTPISVLLRTVFESILEVFILCLAGWFLAKKNILDKKTQKQLNRVNVSLFTPSLLFSKVAFFLSPAKLRELWIIPLFFVLVSGVSMITAQLLARLFRLKRTQRNFAVAASMFMNSNSLPIALMQSLVVTVPGLQWDDTDNVESMLGRALTYLVLYSTLGMILRWSYGVHLLSQADDAPKPVDEPNDISPPLRMNSESEAARPLSSSDDDLASTSSREDIRNPPSQQTLVAPTDRAVSPLSPAGVNPASHMFYSFPNTPVYSRSKVNVSRPDGDDEDSTDDDEPLRFSSQAERRRKRWFKWKVPKRLKGTVKFLRKFWKQFSEFMTVPLWAALASLVVACTPPLQHQLEDHTKPLKGALQAAGACSIPITLVVLGGYFFTPPEERAGSNSQNQSGGLPTLSNPGLPSEASLVGSIRQDVRTAFRMKPVRQKSLLAARSDPTRPGESQAVFVAVVSRMVLTPLVLFPLFAISARFNLHDLFEDPVFVVSSVLLVSSPPALTLAQITQKASGDAFERLISRTIFWSYCILTPPATILYVVLGLWASKL